MRIVVVNAFEPFAVGGAEYLATSLIQALQEHGHEVTLIQIPFSDPGEGKVLDRMKATSLLSLNGPSVDLVIGLKFPAYLIEHDNKVIWLLHQYRQAYELWDRGIGHLTIEQDGLEYRDAIRRSDDSALRSAKRVFALSKNVAGRLRKYNAFDAAHLYCPPPLQDQFYCAEAEDYFFCISRPDPLKRQELVIEALAKCKTSARVVFSGLFLDDGYFRHLQNKAAELYVSDRIDWIGNINDAQKVDLYACCLGVVFVPVDEDYGFVTPEAMLSGKPVITASDAGGALEFITDREHGLVVEPTPEALAEAMDELWTDRQLAKSMGAAAKDRYAAMDIGWDLVVKTLTAA